MFGWLTRPKCKHNDDRDYQAWVDTVAADEMKHIELTKEVEETKSSYSINVSFTVGRNKVIHRSFSGKALHVGFSYDGPALYIYNHAEVVAYDDMVSTKEYLCKYGITDGHTVYLSHTISKVEFSEITTKGE